MIDTREYETREDLEKAMNQMHRDQLVQLMHGKYGIIKSDIEQMSSLIQYPFANKCAALDRHTIYWTAYRIEELAKSGKAVIVLSTADFPQSICTKIYSLSDGELKNEK